MKEAIDACVSFALDNDVENCDAVSVQPKSNGDGLFYYLRASKTVAGSEENKYSQTGEGNWSCVADSRRVLEEARTSGKLDHSQPLSESSPQIVV